MSVAAVLIGASLALLVLGLVLTTLCILDAVLHPYEHEERAYSKEDANV